VLWQSRCHVRAYLYLDLTSVATLALLSSLDAPQYQTVQPRVLRILACVVYNMVVYNSLPLCTLFEEYPSTTKICLVINIFYCNIIYTNSNPNS